MKEFESQTVIYDLDVATQKTITTSPGQESSVEISRDGKGEPKLTVKVYHADADVALDKAIELYQAGLQRLGGAK